MTELFTLFSSSEGNCTCLSSGGTTLLIDAGGNCKKIVAALREHGLDASRLSGIVLTHEHSDHISALKVFLKHYPVPVYGTFSTINTLADKDLVPPQAELCPLAGGGMVGDIAFDIFPTQHDAADTCGYAFDLPDGGRVGFATDLGRFTDEVRAGLSGCGLVVLESNYDPHMLAVSGYPYPLIRRIKGGWGHLSNEDCASAAVLLAHGGTRQILLAHTSKQNNFEELAAQTTVAALRMDGVAEEGMRVEVAPKFACSPVLTL